MVLSSLLPLYMNINQRDEINHQTVFLPDQPGVHPLQPDCGDVLGQFLPGQRLCTSKSGAWSDNRSHHGHAHGGCEQVDRYI